MRKPNYITLTGFLKKAFVVIAFISVAQYVFAVDGILNGGGAKNKSSRAKFSNVKNDINLSLKYGYSPSGNKTFSYKKNDRFVMFNSVVTYQKGNITYVLPIKNKVILQKFKTPAPPPIR
ncbi:MAG: hypothetical protein SFU87_08430 [Chitinophagaceae bacterium]|nr:hypothetical protein [Chitinophagaceae bacterium]